MVQNEKDEIENQPENIGPGLTGVEYANGNVTEKDATPPSSVREVTAEAILEGNEEAKGDQDSDADSIQDDVAESTEMNELQVAQEEIEKLKDSWTRERAEFQNYKRRTAQEMSRFRAMNVADFVSALMPALDNLGTVLNAKTDNAEVKNFISGVEMIQKEMVNVLERYNIKVIQASDQPFDPELMEGIATEDRPELKEDRVIDVFQEGYYLELEGGDRKILRPARVKVGRAAGASPD